MSAPVKQRKQFAIAAALARKQDQLLGLLPPELVREIGMKIPGLEEPTQKEVQALMEKARRQQLLANQRRLIELGILSADGRSLVAEEPLRIPRDPSGRQRPRRR